MELNEIRKKIDLIDDKIIELIAERFDLCESVSKCKKEQNLNLKDNNRENQIVNKKITKLSNLGHHEPEFVNKLYSLILNKSRDKIKQFLEIKNKPNKVISIIGGRGKMGSLFAKEFEKKGYQILISNENKTNNIELAKKGDLVIVSVPIKKTNEVLKEIVPHLKENSLLTDFTSIKKEVVDVMKETKSSYVGGHPLFGPTNCLQDKKFILTTGKGNYQWYQELLQSLGLKVVSMSAEEHDRNMATIQCLTHFTNLSFVNYLNKTNLNKELSTPTYQLRIESIKKMFLQDAELFTEIMFNNEMSKKVARNYLNSVQELHEIVNLQNKQKFESVFNNSKNGF